MALLIKWRERSHLGGSISSTGTWARAGRLADVDLIGGLKLLWQEVETLGESSCAEEQDGWPAVLVEKGSRSFHAGRDEGLGRSLGFRLLGRPTGLSKLHFVLGGERRVSLSVNRGAWRVPSAASHG
ncbi:hypothetical protein ACFL5O_06285 [Myxococcota bacterium]